MTSIATWSVCSEIMNKIYDLRDPSLSACLRAIGIVRDKNVASHPTTIEILCQFIECLRQDCWKETLKRVWSARLMAVKLFSIVVFLCSLLEIIALEQNTKLENLPLSRSLGFGINNLGRNLNDARLNQEFMQKYQEIIRASRESFESVDGRSEKRFRRVVDEDNLDVLKEAMMLDRRRSSRMQSAVGRRRARSQATRRERLNSQSLKSHIQHIRHKAPSVDY